MWACVSFLRWGPAADVSLWVLGPRFVLMIFCKKIMLQPGFRTATVQQKGRILPLGCKVFHVEGRLSFFLSVVVSIVGPNHYNPSAAQCVQTTV